MGSMGSEGETHANQSTSVPTAETDRGFPKMPGTEASSRSGRKTGDERARAIPGCGLMIPAIEAAAKLGDPVDRAEGRPAVVLRRCRPRRALQRAPRLP